MKAQSLTPSSSTSTSTTTVKSSAMEDEDRSESRDSCYFPGCRKDANCDCEICLASINATLDLMPISVQKNSLTKFSVSKPIPPPSPVSFNPSMGSTPRMKTTRFVHHDSPSLKSTARLRVKDGMKERKRNWGSDFKCFFRLFLFLGLIFLAEFGVSWVVSGVLKTELSSDLVTRVGEKSWVVKDLNGKLGFLQRELQSIVDGRVSNCSYANSIWKINHEGLLLYSRCTLYKSGTEEVSVWGWPLQTAGLIVTGFSSKSFTVLSGRVTEWSDGRVGYSIRKANNSWTSGKWSAAVLQLDRNTWILEYRRNLILENEGLLSAALKLLKLRISRSIGRMKQKFWILSFENEFSDLNTKRSSEIPT